MSDQPRFTVEQPIVKGQLTAEQQRAVFTDGGRLLLSASAGSGKTSVLTRRVVEKLKAGVPIQELLVVTFTNAAAAEMRKRIGDELKKERDHATDTEMRRRLSRQILDLPQARICTMDAFYGEFVRRNFQQLDVSPDFRVVLGPEYDLLCRSTMQGVFDALYEEENEAFLRCVDVFSGERDDIGFYEQMLELIRTLDSEPFPEQKLAQLQAMFEHGELEKSPWYRYFCQALKEGLEELQPVFAEIAEYAAAHRVELGDKIADQRLEDLDQVNTALNALRQGVIPSCPVFERLSPLNAKHRTYEWYRLIHPKAKAARSRVANVYEKLHIPSAAAFAQQQQMCADLTAGMRLVAHRYYKADRAVKRRKNILSFADASRLTLSLLVNGYDPQTDRVEMSDYARAYISGELGPRIEEVLIDEYQDTNLLQNLIFLALSDNGENLFCVGDLKQSIYRFRKARPDLFAGQLHRFSEKEFPQVQFLTRNFRSAKGVLGFVNFFFSLIMSRVSGGADYDHTQWAYVAGEFPDGDTDTEILLCDDNNTDWQESGDYRQGQMCALRIQELMAQGRTVWDAKTQTSRPLDYRDIVILMRAAKGHADAVVKALTDAGIPAYSAKARSYFDRYEVKFVLSFLRAVDNPYLDIPMAAALRSPIFCFSAQELCDLREQGKGCLYDCLAQSDEPKAKQAKAVLDRYRTRSGAQPVYRLIWDLYGEFSLFAAVGAMADAPSRQENLRLIYRHARDYENSSLRGLYGFLCYMERVEEQLRNAEGANPAPAAPHVTVSTIHAVKGLEYPYVFVLHMENAAVPSMTGRSRMAYSDEYGLGLRIKDRAKRMVYDTFARSAVLSANREEEIAEMLRLLYVAFTRAKEKLFLVGSIGIQDRETAKTVSKGRLPVFLSQALALVGHGSIGPRLVQSCASPLELILLAALRHPVGLDFAEQVGVEVPEGIFPDTDRLEHSILTEPLGERRGIFGLHIRIIEPISANTVQASQTQPLMDMSQLESILSYQYPLEELKSVPAKVSVSDLKGLRDMDDDAGLMLDRQINYDKPAFLCQGLTAAERGTATHKFMQFITFDDTPLVLLRERMIRNGTLSQAEAEALDMEQIEGFRQSDLARRIAASSYVEREYRFLSQVPVEQYDPSLTDASQTVMLQGVIDLFFEENDGITLVDYKTDRNSDPSYYQQRYALQLSLYAQALEKLLQKPVKRCVVYALSCQKEIEV